MEHSIKGSIVALVTPMHADGSMHWDALDNLVDWHAEQGTSALVAVGTTGESATLNPEEHCEVIKRVVDRAAGRLPVIAGTGANSTSEALELTEAAARMGADACLLVTPYYNKPTQEGLYQHYKYLAERVDIAQILYNVPGRTACDMSNETVARLADIPNIVGIKDATGDIERGKQLIALVKQRMAVYSGDDATAVELMLAGAHGNISVTANVAPADMAELCRLAFAGEADAARDLNAKLMPLHTKLFVESNPIPVKWALAEMGWMDGGIRLPLVELSPNARAEVLEALRRTGMIR